MPSVSSNNSFFLRCPFCASVFLLTCILHVFLFNADVNWLPGSASPNGYSRELDVL